MGGPVRMKGEEVNAKPIDPQAKGGGYGAEDT